MDKTHNGHKLVAFWGNPTDGYVCWTCGRPIGMEPGPRYGVVASGSAVLRIGERSSGRAGDLSIQREAR